MTQKQQITIERIMYADGTVVMMTKNSAITLDNLCALAESMYPGRDYNASEYMGYPEVEILREDGHGQQ